MNTTQRRPLDFVTALGDQMPGRKVKITFKRESIRSGVAYLLGMADSNLFTIEVSDEAAMLAVLESGSWGQDRNRTLILTLTALFDRDWFEDSLNRELESISHVP